MQKRTQGWVLQYIALGTALTSLRALCIGGGERGLDTRTKTCNSQHGRERCGCTCSSAGEVSAALVHPTYGCFWPFLARLARPRQVDLLACPFARGAAEPPPCLNVSTLETEQTETPTEAAACLRSFHFERSRTTLTAYTYTHIPSHHSRQNAQGTLVRPRRQRATNEPGMTMTPATCNWNSLCGATTMTIDIDLKDATTGLYVSASSLVLVLQQRDCLCATRGGD